MDIDTDSDEGQIDTWSGGDPGDIPNTTTVTHEADDHKESLHFFPNNQLIVRLIKTLNMLPEDALTDDVLDTINTTHNLLRFLLSYHSIKRFFFNPDVTPRRATRAQNNRQHKLQAEREEFLKFTADEKEFVRIRKNRDKALFSVIKDQCNDFVGLLMMALAYLGQGTSKTATCDPPEGKEEPAQ
jgi:hypothetical protein